MGLVNPSFDPPYAPRGANEIQLATGWYPFWSTGNPPHEINQGPCARPEYKPATRAVDAWRVWDTDTAQCWFAFSKVMDAGIYQQVIVEKRALVFSIQAQAWCSNGDDPRVSDGEMYVALGIDPYGKTDPFELGVIWTPWKPLTGEYQRFVSVPVMPDVDRITVFVRAWNKWRLKHNDIYVDTAGLAYVEGQPPVEPQPEPGTGPSLAEIRQAIREELGGLTVSLAVRP